jgi:hypothetical protein
MQNSGFVCREIADVCLITARSQRVARECAPDARLRDEVIQTFTAVRWDCFACARNDGNGCLKTE